MGSFSIWHWIVVLAIVLLLFGTGRVSNLMGDLAKGVKAFKKGLQDDDEDGHKAEGGEPKVLTADSAKPAAGVEKDEAAKH
jgi:sec-independent protein translocase protein TatA